MSYSLPPGFLSSHTLMATLFVLGSRFLDTFSSTEKKDSVSESKLEAEKVKKEREEIIEKFKAQSQIQGFRVLMNILLLLSDFEEKIKGSDPLVCATTFLFIAKYGNFSDEKSQRLQFLILSSQSLDKFRLLNPGIHYDKLLFLTEENIKASIDYFSEDGRLPVLDKALQENVRPKPLVKPPETKSALIGAQRTKEEHDVEIKEDKKEAEEFFVWDLNEASSLSLDEVRAIEKSYEPISKKVAEFFRGKEVVLCNLIRNMNGIAFLSHPHVSGIRESLGEIFFDCFEPNTVDLSKSYRIWEYEACRIYCTHKGAVKGLAWIVYSNLYPYRDQLKLSLKMIELKFSSHTYYGVILNYSEKKSDWIMFDTLVFTRAIVPYDDFILMAQYSRKTSEVPSETILNLEVEQISSIQKLKKLRSLLWSTWSQKCLEMVQDRLLKKAYFLNPNNLSGLKDKDKKDRSDLYQGIIASCAIYYDLLKTKQKNKLPRIRFFLGVLNLKNTQYLSEYLKESLMRGNPHSGQLWCAILFFSKRGYLRRR